jgi:hypothetical protein
MNQLAFNTALQIPTRGIPSCVLNVMKHEHIERLAGAEPGAYKMNPRKVYHAMQLAVGTCAIEQYIPENPLTMGDEGFEGEAHSPTQGVAEIWRDGMLIDSPEAAAEHLEKVEFPRLRERAAGFDEEARTLEILKEERDAQTELGPTILKTGYAFVWFPVFGYNEYGYEHYFGAYALFPEIMEEHFKLQADLCLRNNRAAAAAYATGELAPMNLIDFDMADSRGTLVDVRSLDRIWFPHFARCIEPVVKQGTRLIWHCDGNLMQMVPRLIEAGVKGFQGFQYECGMDYPAICQMKTRDGEPLLIQAGVSVTRTLPHGTPQDVRDEMKWLVENGPRVGLLLGESSSMVPGVPWDNLATMVEGLRHYREHGRA